MLVTSELLRRAATLMRERAEAATPGRWDAVVLGSEGYDVRAPNLDSPIRRIRVARCDYEKWETDRANAEHIASLHPDVALAVADSLDTAAADLWAHGPLCCAEGCTECDDDLWAPHVRRALAVARAYLGGERC